MDTVSGSTEFDLRKALEFARDDPNGPSVRCRKVYDYLVQSNRFTNWDVLCFAVEYIASQVATLPWLEPPAKWLVRLLYLANYLRFSEHAWLDNAPISGSALSSETESDGESTTGQ